LANEQDPLSEVNGDFNTYWAWHEQQEFTRNHQARYRNTLIPTA
jgi:hypothetical protein